MIDYVIKATGREKIIYLGHSQGTTTFFVMASEKPEYQDKIQAMFALAPVAYCGRMDNPILKVLAGLSGPINVIASSNLDKKIIVFFFFLNNFHGLVAGIDGTARHVRVHAYYRRHEAVQKACLRGRRHHATLVPERALLDRWI